MNWNAVPTLFDVPNPPKRQTSRRHPALRQREQVPPIPVQKLIKTINYVRKEQAKRKLALQQRRDQFQMVKINQKYLQLKKTVQSKNNAIQYLQRQGALSKDRPKLTSSWSL